jgi:hypothetical protein
MLGEPSQIHSGFSTSCTSRAGWVWLTFRSNPDDLESLQIGSSLLRIQLKSGPYGGFDRGNPSEIGFHGGGMVCLSDEDMNISIETMKIRAGFSLARTQRLSSGTMAKPES